MMMMKLLGPYSLFIIVTISSPCNLLAFTTPTTIHVSRATSNTLLKMQTNINNNNNNNNISNNSNNNNETPIHNYRMMKKRKNQVLSKNNNHVDDHHNHNERRRQFLSKIMQSTLLFTTTTVAMNTIIPTPSFAAEEITSSSSSSAAAVNTIEMKTFIDQKGLFVINVPKRFFAIRRTVKGDLPDETTGKGRRGSSIFTAGDMSKAEVIAIERFPTKVLLEEEGILPSGDLSTFSSIGDPTAIANLIAIRRDRDKQAQLRTTVIPNSVSLSDSGKTLRFKLSQSIDVQKPELLMEQMGVSELVRVTFAKATLNSNDGQMMAVFASALEQDFLDVDGPALEESVMSFVAIDQSSKNN